MSLRQIIINSINDIELEKQFDNLRKNIELSDRQIETIINSHKYLRNVILTNCSIVTDTFLTGSYKRQTMICPPNDIDLFALIKPNLINASPINILKALKVYLKKSYPNSIIKEDKPCIVIDFTHCKFEITPTIIHLNNYHIPNIENLRQWRCIEDPKIIEKKLSEANKNLNNKLVPLIKIMKKCKYFNNIINIKSYEMEKIAITNLRELNSYRKGVQDLLYYYGWINIETHKELCLLSKDQFMQYCNNNLFGSEFR